MKKECIKKQYSRREVDEELTRLEQEEPELYWQGFGCNCGSWHIERIAPPGYVSEEKKKAIALWKEKHGLT